MRPVCHVFGAGSPPNIPPEINGLDIVIAADGGYIYTQDAGIRVDAIIGDFDSLGSVPEQGTCKPAVIRLPVEKDQTDMLAALVHGLERGFTRFNLYGGMGGRFDHTLANIQCLAFLLSQGARGYLHGEGVVITALRGGLRLARRETGIISVFALGGPAEGVCLRGLKYGLEHAALSPDFPLGVSNEFIGQPAHISAERGDLLIVYPTGTQEQDACG